jgi:glyoxylase-like metal-dependent hydrolase (beta-lactamase superfamily II)
MLVKDPPVEIIDNLWMLGTNLYPLYLFQGSRGGTIVEGGTGAMGPILREQLAQLGIAADTIRQVIVTHAHPDHVMAVPLFREMFPQVSVIASAPAAKTLQAEKAVAFFCKMDDMLTGALIQSGVVGEQHRRGPLAANLIAVDRVVKDGDTIEVDAGVVLEVLETPGHSDCSLSFHDRARRVLIISDATGYYVPQYDTWWPNYFADYAAYLRSIERLAALDADVLCLSHNAVIRGVDAVQDYFRRALAVTQAYHERIVADVRVGKTPDQIAAALGAEVYEKTQLMPPDFFVKNCGLLVKVSLKHAQIG